ncbi:hypothetical protein [Lentzea sp. NBRC 102530]|uniref:hypothetical protein n=1 Tax=Lentzea sp. NBRC 102530 TaxID=3032201 RepID=UPI0024A5451C|nr:hypothetical protein [Lentzea sp. NBRC 102530]GLY47319.1 hypothetical protein Lesp01_09750 [Lentzea sp. NBRC 102530]
MRERSQGRGRKSSYAGALFACYRGSTVFIGNCELVRATPGRLVSADIDLILERLRQVR